MRKALPVALVLISILGCEKPTPEPEEFRVEKVTILPPGGIDVHSITAHIYTQGSGQLQVDWYCFTKQITDSLVQSDYIVVDSSGRYEATLKTQDSWYWAEVSNYETGAFLLKTDSVCCGPDSMLPPIAYFEVFNGDPVSGPAPFDVLFVNKSLRATLDAFWDFGDGDTLWKINFAQHTYETPGSYNVTLIAVNDYGRDTCTRQDYITVY